LKQPLHGLLRFATILKINFFSGEGSHAATSRLPKNKSKPEGLQGRHFN